MSVDLDLAQRIIDFLNVALVTDPDAVSALFSFRTPCNDRLRDHPTIQVHTQDDASTVSLIGLLNGLCGVYDDGKRAQWGAVSLCRRPSDDRVLSFDLIANEPGTPLGEDAARLQELEAQVRTLQAEKALLDEARRHLTEWYQADDYDAFEECKKLSILLHRGTPAEPTELPVGDA